jgi:hypothetical protein
MCVFNNGAYMFAKRLCPLIDNQWAQCGAVVTAS